MSSMASLCTATPTLQRQQGLLTRPGPLSLARAHPAARASPALRRGPQPGAKRGQAVQTRAVAEVAQLAGEAGEISSTAAIVFAITLVGLAVGFVLLRVESLVEEGKI